MKQFIIITLITIASTGLAIAQATWQYGSNSIRAIDSYGMPLVSVGSFNVGTSVSLNNDAQLSIYGTGTNKLSVNGRRYGLWSGSEVDKTLGKVKGIANVYLTEAQSWSTHGYLNGINSNVSLSTLAGDPGKSPHAFGGRFGLQFNSDFSLGNITGVNYCYMAGLRSYIVGTFNEVVKDNDDVIVSAFLSQDYIKSDGNTWAGYFDGNLAVTQKIYAEEIFIKLKEDWSWPDYVFNTDYKLRSLNEVESFIQQNNHLPDMPSAKQVEDDGIGVGEMNKLLLQKVEELTLYMIELKKQNEALQQQMNNLTK